ncbi:MAG: signal peptidase I [Clostridiales Family XIII bacterium]|jgi:signal peptidase I|nr:signal peptidase I [Clostridiales Family XIII bacterium]
MSFETEKIENWTDPRPRAMGSADSEEGDTRAEDDAAQEDVILEDKPSIWKGMLLLLRDIAIAFVVIIIILQFIKPTIVFEHSMEDTLHPQDYVFLAKQAYVFGAVEHGDIIVFRSNLPDDYGGTKNLIKRVIGLPGDTIEVRDGAVYRNGARLDEPYTKEGITEGEMAPVVVPADSYFAMGDNRRVSLDSRDPRIGCIPADDIRGKVFFRLFPLSTIGAVGGTGTAEAAG